MRPFLSILGILTAVAGLFLAAGTRDGGMFFGGMLFFAFGVLLNFWLIGTADHKPVSAGKRPATLSAE